MRSRSGDTEAEVSQSLASRLFKSSAARCFANNLKPLTKLFKLEASSETGILSETNTVHCTFVAPDQFGQLSLWSQIIHFAPLNQGPQKSI